MNSTLFLLIILNRCTLFHEYVRSPLALEAKSKFICNVKQFKFKTNTKTAHDNEDWYHKSSRDAEDKDVT